MKALTIQGTIDLDSYIANTDVSQVPSEKEVDEILLKRLTKGAIELHALAEDAAIAQGDVVTFAITGETAKYHKPKLAVTVGNGLYSREVEGSMMGHKIGDTYEAEAEGAPVTITIMEAKRKVVPQPTDAMASAMGVPEVNTIADYREYLSMEIMEETIYPMATQIMEQIEADHPVSEPTEDVIAALCKMELACYRDMILESEQIDILTASSEQLMELLGINTLDSFETDRREWYIQQAKQCSLCAAILGVKLEGDNDPLENYMAHSKLCSELLEKLYQKIMKKVTGGQ